MAEARHCPLCAAGRVRDYARVGERRYFECEVCALVHLAPWQRLSREAERAYYGLHENEPSDPRYRAFLDRLATPLASRLAKGAEGLDYGAGPGPTLSGMLQERGFDVQVYDPLFAPHGGALERTYDFVACSETVEHFFSPRKEFARLDRLLRPEGWLGVMTGMRPEGQGFATWHYARDPTHVSFYSHRTMRWIAAAFGWALHFPGRNVALFCKNAGDQPGSARSLTTIRGQ